MPDKKQHQKKSHKKKKAQAKKKTSTKKQTSTAMAKVVECKKRTLGVQNGFVSPVTYFTSFPCRSFIENEQGLGEDQMVGQTIFSKYYSMKIKLNFPVDHPIVDNFRAQLCWGWVTAPLAYTSQVDDSSVDPSRTTVSRENINNRIMYCVEDGFNQKVDQMNFRDKEKRIYKVVGKRWVMPDRRYQIGQKQGATAYVDPDDNNKVKVATTGSLPPWTHQITMRPNRKIKMTYTSGAIPPESSTPFYYPNESWIPWVGLFTPNIDSYYEDGGVIPDGAKISYQVNDCHWYQDS